MRQEANAALLSLGLAAPRHWDQFRRDVAALGDQPAAKPVLIDLHLVTEDPDFEHTARYYFILVTSGNFDLNPAALDQMIVWARMLSMAYRSSDLFYWTGEKPPFERFALAVEDAFGALSPSGDFIQVGFLWDHLCKTLHVSPILFEVRMLKYIEENARRVRISGAVGLDRRTVGSTFYQLRPRLQGPPWFEKRWFADGLRTDRGNIKFVRLE